MVLLLQRVLTEQKYSARGHEMKKFGVLRILRKNAIKSFPHFIRNLRIMQKNTNIGPKTFLQPPSKKDD